jgi:hypothetical protein
MGNRNNWFVIGMLFIIQGMLVETWPKYVLNTIGGLLIISSFASEKKDS